MAVGAVGSSGTKIRLVALSISGEEEARVRAGRGMAIRAVGAACTADQLVADAVTGTGAAVVADRRVAVRTVRAQRTVGLVADSIAGRGANIRAGSRTPGSHSAGSSTAGAPTTCACASASGPSTAGAGCAAASDRSSGTGAAVCPAPGPSTTGSCPEFVRGQHVLHRTEGSVAAGVRSRTLVVPAGANPDDAATGVSLRTFAVDTASELTVLRMWRVRAAGKQDEQTRQSESAESAESARSTSPHRTHASNRTIPIVYGHKLSTKYLSPAPRRETTAPRGRRSIILRAA
jgi:hypothetical protein